ncbi:TlpA family protein disulfide reductase [Sphingobacteriales bacterium UPWRP_1]|nr:hypothetical protein BVG80_04950 [Sphingobacteriales bacterium TSM_CSM]PSJ76231.1 TlpA family protein disulfide reductase [Sphingobacteriales bacterium UPWRP_1]
MCNFVPRKGRHTNPHLTIWRSSDGYTYTAAIENLHLPPDAQLTVLLPNEQTTLQNILNPFWGKVVYIDFWATWCAPCLQEMEHSVALQQMYEGEDVVFLYLSLDQTADKWRTKIAELGVNGYHYLLNSALTTEVAKLWQLGAIPRYMLVSKQGVMVNPNAPNPTNNQLIVQLDNLLNK